jgi:dihydroorotate dehydrogenase (fumarate)
MERNNEMVDLSTTYLGLNLKNPLVASASPLSSKVETALQLENAGASAIVMYSLFEEQITRESLKLHEDLERGTYQFAEALTYIPEIGQYSIGPDKYVDEVRRLKKALQIPVIGSLNGVSSGGWIDFAKKIEQAGADALELNLYYLATDPNLTSSELENRYIHLVSNVCEQVRIPLAVKISPFITALPNFASRLAQAGARGLVLFNRFYQPDFDLDQLEVIPNLVLSSSQELRLPLRWIAILFGRVTIDLALTTGIHSGEDLIKAVMAGSSVGMSASALLKQGPAYATTILDEMCTWMEEHEYASVEQMKGSMSQRAVTDPASFERANYMKVLSSY